MVRITNIRTMSDTTIGRTPGIDRRTILKGAAAGAGLAGGALGGSHAWAHQASPVATPDGSPVADASPIASPVANAQGFDPSGVEGVPDAYLTPPEPFTSYDGVPGEGGTVSAFVISYAPPPPPREQNQYWRELERRLGVSWEPILTPQPDYGARSATLIASGDIPDLFVINPGQNAPQQYQAMAQGAFLDLTPYVTGDALAEYRNLSTFPAYMWENAKFQGKIFGVPKPLWRNGNLPFYRQDWAETLGMGAPASPQEVRDLLVGFSSGDPNGNGNQDTWGMGRFEGGWRSWDNILAFPMFGTPNNWRLNDDGTMTFMIETDEYRQAVEFLTQLYADGAYHPDASAMTFADAQNNFIAGSTGLHFEGFLSFYGQGSVTDRAQEQNPSAVTAPFFPPGPGGNPGVVYNETGFFGYTGIPSSLGGDENRVRELLRILDYLAAPFGSEESIFLGSGIEGVHHEVQENNVRITNDLFQTERSDLAAVMGGLAVYYYPQTPELALEIQQTALQAVELGIDNPAQTLYSETNVREGGTLDQFGQDRLTAIVTGREPLDSLADAIQQWKDRGGETIREEYEQALQDQ